jgi:hypothetical protein
MTDTKLETRTVYAAWVNYEDKVEIASAEAVCTKKLARLTSRGGAAFGCRVCLNLSDVYFTPDGALAALHANLRAKLECREGEVELLKKQLQMKPWRAAR